MIVLYRRGRDPSVFELEIASFQDFENWLWGLGAGQEGARQQARIWWAETFRAMQEPGFQPACVALGRSEELGDQVVIVGAR